ncbi:hypothetical protein VP01_9874g1, partial [Puccinia sorghi]
LAIYNLNRNKWLNHKLKNRGYYADIQHGNNLKKSAWTNRPNSLNLRVSLFLNWFNPCGNKISGKLKSTGTGKSSMIDSVGVCAAVCPARRAEFDQDSRAGESPIGLARLTMRGGFPNQGINFSLRTFVHSPVSNLSS